MRTICLLLYLTAFALAQPGYSLDGIRLGMKADQVSWLDNPADGQCTHQGTTVELRSGKVVGVWGQTLEQGGKVLLRLGDSDPRAALGKPDRVLYGCGPQGGQQVLFYDRNGLLVTVENGQKVVGLCLQSP